MPRDGTSGAFSLVAGNPVVSGTSISSTVHNATMTDVASALTGSIAKDGQTVPTQNLPMGGFIHTGVGNATARNQYLSVEQEQDGECRTLGSVSGTNTITGSLSPAITAYVGGMMVAFEPAVTNTGATTLSVNGVGAIAVQNPDGTACIGGELKAGFPVLLVMNSALTAWIIVGAPYASGTFTITLTGVSGTVTSTASYSRVGRSVALFIPITQGTSTSTSATFTGLPTVIRMITSVCALPLCQIVNNSVTENSAGSIAQINTDGTVTLFRGGSSTGWTAANVKGINTALCLNYLVT